MKHYNIAYKKIRLFQSGIMELMKALFVLFFFILFFVPAVMAQETVLVTVTHTPAPTQPPPCITSGSLTPQPSCAVQVNQRDLGFRIPTLSEILTFAIRGFFIIAGLVALVYLLLGALAWIMSGGDKENIAKAQSKITSAIVGVILIVVVLAIVVTLEQVVFARRLCLGLSCPITIPSLLKSPDSTPSSDTGSFTVGDEPTLTLTPVPPTNAPQSEDLPNTP